MFNDIYDIENFGNQSQRQKARYKQYNDYLDANPNFEQRFLAFTERYAVLPPEILKPLAESDIPVDAKSVQDLTDLFVQEKAVQAANDWAEVSKDYKSKGYNDDMTMNMLQVFGIGYLIDNGLYVARKALEAVTPLEIPEDGGEFDTPIGQIDLTPEEFTNPIEFAKNLSLWTIATFDAISETYAKYTPSYRSSIQKPFIDKTTGELVTPEEYEALSPLKKGLLGIPGLNLLLPENKALFNGRTWAYAQQMNAMDEYMERGETQEYAQQFIPIDFRTTNVQSLGKKGGWLQETKDWISFAQEAKDKGGEAYLFEMLNQVRSSQPVNYNRNNIITVESLMAKDSQGNYKPEILELVQRGWSEQDAEKIYYANVGQPIVKPNENGAIHWTSIQRPQQIEAFAGRKFIYNPELAQEYAENKQANMNEILGIQTPYSSGRYQASLRYDVGSDEYKTMSGWIDGYERILPEIAGGGAIKFLKKASKLTKSLNKLNKFDDTELFTPVKREEIITDWVKTNKANPVTGEAIDDVDNFITNFDYKVKDKNLVKDLSDTVIGARNKTNKLRKEYGLFGGRATGMFDTTTEKIVSKLTNGGILDNLVQNKSWSQLDNIPWTQKFPEKVQELTIEIDNLEDMQSLFTKIYSDQGLKLPGMNEIFKLDTLPKGQSNLLSSALTAAKGTPVTVPSLGSMAGRMANKTLNAVDSVTNLPRQFNAGGLKMLKPKILDGKRVLDKEEFYRWNRTGDNNLGRNLGFYAEFSEGMSPQWRKMLSVQPSSSLNYFSRQKAFETLKRHLRSTGYGTAKADIILQDFANIKNWSVSSANKFAKRLQDADLQLVKERAGTARYEVMKRRFDELYRDETQLKGYMADPEGNLVYDSFSPKITNPDTGETQFIPSASLLSETANQGAPLTNNRMMNRLMGRYFTEIEPLISKRGFASNALDNMKNLIEKEGFFAGLKIPTTKIENDAATAVWDFWTNTYFKPKAIAKPALTQRVMFEEQLAFFIHPDLTSLFDHPLKTLQWTYSYGQLPKRSPLKKLMKQIIDSGEDINDITMSTIFHDALAANFGYQGLNYKNINSKLVNYVPVSANNPKSLEGYILQYQKLRHDDFARKIVELGWGTDKLAQWMVSSDAAKMIDNYIATMGSSMNKLKTEEGLLEHLNKIEASIRMRTGMSMQKGKHYGVYDVGPKKGQHWFDNSFTDTGDLELRQGIITGKVEKIIDGKTVKFDLAPDTKDFFAKYSIKQERDMQNGFKLIVDQETFDAGKVLIKDPKIAESQLAKANEKLDSMLNNTFNFLLSEPLARLHRSPKFKEYRWLYLTSYFEEFTPKLQKELIAEAVAAAIPNSVIQLLKGTAALKSGKIDNYQTISNLASSHALHSLKELLYDTKTRHRISEIGRNIFPFPEVFFEMGRRWSKLTAMNPYYIRQGATTYKGLRAAGNVYSYENQGTFVKDPDTGEDMFIMPFNAKFNNLLFGQDSAFKMIARGFASGINMISSQVYPSTTPLVSFGTKWLFDKTNVSQEFADDFFGSFPPPDNFIEALAGGRIPYLDKLRASLGGTKAGVDLVREALSETYVDPDNNFQKWEMSSKVEHMRAESTIDVWDAIKSSHDEERLFNNGELDKYIYAIYEEWDGNRNILNVNDFRKAYLENNNLPIDLPKGVLTPAILDLALMRYSAHKGRWLNLYRFISQFGFITGGVFESAVKDKSGKWWMTAVLAGEYQQLLDQYSGDNVAAANAFYGKYGFEHSYVTTSSKERDVRAKTFNATVKTWKEKNADNLVRFKTTYQFLNYDNPEIERSYADMIAQATMNPTDYMLYANDSAAGVQYKKFSRDIEDNPNLSFAEKDMYKKSYRYALMDTRPGFLRAFGQTETPTSQVRFDEMRTQWLTSDYALSTEAGKGFAEFYEAFKDAEELSVELGNSSTWWRSSKDPVAFTIRSQIAAYAYSVIADYPDFYPIWQNVIIRLMSSDKEFMKYNTALEQNKRKVGTK
jgi:hypothetical protein